jgi:hypothetical protein
MDLKFDTLISNGTWILYPRPLEHNIIRNKWVYKIKNKRVYKIKKKANVGQEFHLVPEMLLLPSGLILTSGLLTNGLVQDNLTVEQRGLPKGLLAIRDEKALLSEPNIRFRLVNYFKRDILYHQHQVDRVDE